MYFACEKDVNLGDHRKNVVDWVVLPQINKFHELPESLKIKLSKDDDDKNGDINIIVFNERDCFKWFTRIIVNSLKTQSSGH